MALREVLAQRVREIPKQIEGKSAWDFACDWYKPESIELSIRCKSRYVSGAAVIPENTSSPDFAAWLAEQYQLAMNKGMDLAHAATKSSAAALIAESPELQEVEVEGRRIVAMYEESLENMRQGIAKIIGERDALQAEVESLQAHNQRLIETLTLARKYADLNQPYFGMTQDELFERIDSAMKETPHANP